MKNIDFNDLESVKQHFFSLERKYRNQSRYIDRFGDFPLINFSFYSIKLCGGKYNNSKPRYYYKSIKNYSQMEVWVYSYNNILPNLQSSVNVYKEEIFKKFEWIKYFKSEILGRFVPINELPIIVRDIYKIDKLLPFS